MQTLEDNDKNTTTFDITSLLQDFSMETSSLPTPLHTAEEYDDRTQALDHLTAAQTLPGLPLDHLPALPPSRPVTPPVTHQAPPIAPPKELHWPTSLPVPTLAQEEHVRKALFTSTKKYYWKNSEPRDYEDLPPARKQKINVAIGQVGMTLPQALSLRNHLLLSAAPHLWHGFEYLGHEAGARFEDNVEAFLAAQGIEFITQAQQQAALEVARRLDPTTPATVTPDFILKEPVLINGLLVKWIEVKCFYGMASSDMKAWAPTLKVHKQVAKYVARFGNGLLVFKQGYAREFKELLPEGVGIVDGTPCGDCGWD